MYQPAMAVSLETLRILWQRFIAKENAFSPYDSITIIDQFARFESDRRKFVSKKTAWLAELTSPGTDSDRHEAKVAGGLLQIDDEVQAAYARVFLSLRLQVSGDE